LKRPRKFMSSEVKSIRDANPISKLGEMKVDL
jgi:hypothetical protein